MKIKSLIVSICVASPIILIGYFTSQRLISDPVLKAEMCPAMPKLAPCKFMGEAELLSFEYKSIKASVNKLRIQTAIAASKDALRYYRTGDRVCIAGDYYPEKSDLKRTKIVPCQEVNDKEFLENIGTIKKIEDGDFVEVKRDGVLVNLKNGNSIKPTDLFYTKDKKVSLFCNGFIGFTNIYPESVKAGRRICHSDKPKDSVWRLWAEALSKEESQNIDQFLSEVTP